MLLGAGRARMDSPVDHAVGVFLHKKVGDPVRIDEPLCTLFVNDESRLPEASALILDAYNITDEPVVTRPLIVKRIAGTLPFGGSPLGHPKTTLAGARTAVGAPPSRYNALELQV